MNKAELTQILLEDPELLTFMQEACQDAHKLRCSLKDVLKNQKWIEEQKEGGENWHVQFSK